MNKQFLFAGAALVAVLLIFMLGNTTKPAKAGAPVKDEPHAHADFSIKTHIDSARTQLLPAANLLLAKLEDNLLQADDKTQKIIALNALATFWKETGKRFEPYASYNAEAAKLDNSEKNLNFAARLFLENLRHDQDAAKLEWGSAQAIALFQQALVLNPESEDLRIGLGSAYVFGQGRAGNAEETMQGVQELLTVVRANPKNMKAQLVLGIGGLISGQLDNAVKRLTTVVEAEPGNVEAVMYLADAYAAKGDKPNAVKWYGLSKRLINDPKYSKEADARIKQIP